MMRLDSDSSSKSHNGECVATPCPAKLPLAGRSVALAEAMFQNSEDGELSHRMHGRRGSASVVDQCCSSDILGFMSTDNRDSREREQVVLSAHKQTSWHIDLEGDSKQGVKSIQGTMRAESGQIRRFLSIDARLPDEPGQDGVFMHLSKRCVESMHTNNLLELCKDESFLKKLDRDLCNASNKHGKNAPAYLSDLAGKLPLALKLMSLGITAESTIIDAAHARGPCQAADGFLVDAISFMEVKGSGPKWRSVLQLRRSRNGRRQYTLHNVLFETWRLLVPVLRPQDPSDWTRAENFDDFWLGAVTREEFVKGISGSRTGTGRKQKKFVVTPDSRCHKSNLSKIIRWVKFRDLTVEWWKKFVLEPLNNGRQGPKP
jgi:hypothetical protein